LTYDGTKQPKRVAIIGTYSPRKCGIATFTHDLQQNLSSQFEDVEFDVVAINDGFAAPNYPAEVKWQIRQDCPADYTATAEQLNRSGVDVISLQHEFGIFGGDSGEYLLLLLRATTIPVVTTLHTLLVNPNRSQRQVMDEIIARSSKLVVMSQKGISILRETYGAPRSKIRLTHHGVHDLPSICKESVQESLGLKNQKVLLTFGLVSPDKGIENAIAAMPDIVKSVPNAVYCVVGETHPHIKRNSGEVYRESLQRRAEELGVGENVKFIDEYVDLEKLGELLAMADVYITPYLKPEQVTSGTLAYALGSGRAIISTPYWYAEELLAEDRGVLVPFNDPASISQAAIHLLTDDAFRKEIRANAFEYGRQMAWHSVANEYFRTFSGTLERPAASLDSRPFSLRHLGALTDCTGILQHATFDIPNRDEWYCIDDNARGLLLAAKLASIAPPDLEAVQSLRDRYFSFVVHAFNPANGRFRNFMSYDRQWLEEAGSEDSHGRAIWALGQFVADTPFAGASHLASDLLRRSLPALAEFTSPRAWAYAMLGLVGLLNAGENDYEIVGTAATLSEKLHRLLVKTRTDDWLWFEDVLSYENARLPQALMLGGAWLARSDMVDEAEDALHWLDSVQRSPDGRFEPVGSDHPYLRGGPRPRFAQQPVDVLASVSAYIAAAGVTRDPTWLEKARRAYAWFLGKNVLSARVFDPETGAGFDGLDAKGVNQNRGAESTLSYLLASAEFYANGGQATVGSAQYAYLR
jgi:glycosyltransferase involved in cell wall biosynthesis